MNDAQRATDSLTACRVRQVALAAAVAGLVGLGAQPAASAQDNTAQDHDASKSARAPAGMSADDVARRVQKFYKKTKDYHARFRQTYTDVAAGEAKESRGRVYFKKPGKMRWDYYKEDGKGRKKVLVSDGASFWIYEYEFKQVFKKCLSESQLPTSLKFLMGQGELLKEFDVSFDEESTPKAPVIDMVPKTPTSKYAKLVFELDPTTFQVDKTTIFDPYGNSNAIDFKDAKFNQNLPDSGFDFEPPKGARLLNPQKECQTPAK